jgi:aryl-phospho-beta-D-glucosidase BglC (GH1 family)
MKNKRFLYLIIIVALIAVAMLPLVGTAQAQTTLPTAAQVAAQIKVGWNLGNTLEATPCGETAWGNPMATQAFIDSVKAAGFNSIRIPAAWDCHTTNGVIDPIWMARVTTVVNYALNDGMYVILNIHWDGGWLENHVTNADKVAVNAKQRNYWTQIANNFKTYNEHLIFAGTNETHQDYAEPTAEYISVQQSYLQTFVDAVRATGGNNASRTLAVQTYNTNIWHGLHYFTMPTDTIANRLMVEVHHYDPYDYTLNGSGPCLAWGAMYTQYSACAWAQEAYVDDLFNQVKTRWIDAGIPVFIGEYGVAKRSGLDLASRAYYIKYMNAVAIANGIKTFYWDNGGTDMGIFNRTTGAVTDQAVLNAIIQGSTPCPTCTSTPTKTPTKTATITMTPCYSCGFKLQYQVGDAGASAQQMTPHFKIFNNSAASVPVSEFTIRYWYTNDGNRAQAFSCDYAAVGCPNVSVSFTKLVYTQTGADNFLEVSFAPAAGSLAAGANTAEIQIRIHKDDFSNYTQTNDYSFDATKTAYTDWDRVTLYRNGDLVWGVEPGMGPTNTPGASNTPTRTPTPTIPPVITPTGTVTNTPTLTPVISATPTRTPTASPTCPCLTNTPTPGITNTPTRTNTPGTPVITNTPTRTFTPTIPPVITNTPTRTFTPTVLIPDPTPTSGPPVCTPVTSIITIPFTFDGAGTFCWQAASLGSFINSWNTTSVSVNGMNATNIWVGVGSYPAKVNGNYYVSYNSAVAWGHFEAKP